MVIIRVMVVRITGTVFIIARIIMLVKRVFFGHGEDERGGQWAKEHSNGGEGRNGGRGGPLNNTERSRLATA